MAGSSFRGRLWVCGALAGMGAIALPSITLAQTAPSTIVEDPTAGTTVIHNLFGLQIEAIRGGTERGQNLFHSFQEFNISPNRAALFLIPSSTIQNIFARVTGQNLSRINGVLGTLLDGSFATSTANLFLINPNGVIFGAGARLNIGGSFVATTANAIQFGDRGSFSATNPGVPSAVLTINPSAFLFEAIVSQKLPEIAVRSNAANSFGGNGLQVPNGQNLLLLGGNVRLEGGTLQAPGGRVELGGLAGAGTVGLNANGSELLFLSGGERSDVTLTNSLTIPSLINVIAEGGGSIAINARNLNIVGGSTLLAGILTGSGTPIRRAGDVTLNATEAIRMDGVVYNTVVPGAVGNAGDIVVNAGSLTATNGAGLSSSTGGQGNAGNVFITVRDAAAFDGIGSFGEPSGAGSQVTSTGVGKGGNVTLSAGSLTVTNGAQLNSSTYGQGNAGNVSIIVRDAAAFDGSSSGGPSGAGSQVASTGVGKGGNVTLSAGSLTVTNGAVLNSNTYGHGDAGNVSIIVRDAAAFDGSSSGGPSGAGSQVTSTGVGKGGNVTLSAGSLTVTNGALLSSSTGGQGNAGNVSITVHDAATFDGVGSNGGSSGAGSQVERVAVGNGGNLILSAGSLTVTHGASLSSSTFKQGDAGNVFITVRDAAIFDGVGSNGDPSGAGSFVAPTGVGKGGNVTLSAGSLTVTNGAQLSSSALGQGQGGAIVLRVDDQLRLSNSSITTFSLLTSGGRIDIAAKDIRLSGNSNIQTNVFSGAGNGGDITLTANSIIALNDSNILAFARDGKGGNITLNTRAFFGQNYRPAPPGTDPLTLIGNGRVDVNASGTVSGIITIPDTTFIQNSLTQLTQNLIDPNTLLANSCIVRDREQNGSFFVTGSGGLPVRPGDAPPASFPTGEVRSLPNAKSQSAHPWQLGDAIVEPQGIYRLPNGKLVMSRECEQ